MSDGLPPLRRPRVEPARPVLITGATGTLGRAFAQACEWRGIDYILTDRARLALGDAEAVSDILDQERPWAVINAAGWVDVDAAENHEEACREANLDGAVGLAAACAARGLALVAFSSDLVFDGALARPYQEDDLPGPLSAYGRSKAGMEQRILSMGSRALIVRTAAFFSERDPHNFASALVTALATGKPFAAADDLTVSPTYTPELVDTVLDLMIDGDCGVRHLVNQGQVSWAHFARMICARLDLNPAMIQAKPAAAMGWKARRPRNCALGTARGVMLTPLDAALEVYAAAVHHRGVEPRPLAMAAE